MDPGRCRRGWVGDAPELVGSGAGVQRGRPRHRRPRLASRGCPLSSPAMGNHGYNMLLTVVRAVGERASRTGGALAVPPATDPSQASGSTELKMDVEWSNCARLVSNSRGTLIECPNSPSHNIAKRSRSRVLATVTSIVGDCQPLPVDTDTASSHRFRVIDTAPVLTRRSIIGATRIRANHTHPQWYSYLDVTRCPPAEESDRGSGLGWIVGEGTFTTPRSSEPVSRSSSRSSWSSSMTRTWTAVLSLARPPPGRRVSGGRAAGRSPTFGGGWGWRGAGRLTQRHLP